MTQLETTVPGIKHGLEAIFCLAGHTVAPKWTPWREATRKIVQAKVPMSVLRLLNNAPTHLGGNCDHPLAERRWISIGNVFDDKCDHK